MGRPNDTRAVDAFTPQTTGQRFDREFHGHVVPPYEPKQARPSYLVKHNPHQEKQAPIPKGGF